MNWTLATRVSRTLGKRVAGWVGLGAFRTAPDPSEWAVCAPH